MKILVVGAGLSGLVAAHRLQAASHKVTILEARSRVGGRVLTVREPFAEGQHADVGAMILYEGQNTILDLCREFGIKLTPVKTVRRSRTPLRPVRRPSPRSGGDRCILRRVGESSVRTSGRAVRDGCGMGATLPSLCSSGRPARRIHRNPAVNSTPLRRRPRLAHWARAVHADGGRE